MDIGIIVWHSKTFRLTGIADINEERSGVPNSDHVCNKSCLHCGPLLCPFKLHDPSWNTASCMCIVETSTVCVMEVCRLFVN